MSKPLEGIGDWAEEAEEAEAEAEEHEQAAGAADNTAAESERFLSKKAPIKTKPKKMSLFEFRMGDYMQQDPLAESKDWMEYEMVKLPTGPKQKSTKEIQHGDPGGGFQSYHRSDAPEGQMKDQDGDNTRPWGSNLASYGGFDGNYVQAPRAFGFSKPSRADQVGNWAAAKQHLPSHSVDSGRRYRYSLLGGGTRGGGSRADEVDNWAIGKKPLPAKSATFDMGFHNSSPEADRSTSKGLLEDNHRNTQLVLDPPSTKIVNDLIGSNKPNPFGHARPREEILAEKGLDWKRLDSDIEYKKISWVISSYPTRSSSTKSSQSEDPLEHVSSGAVKPQPKVNPFGDAKPREVLLEERGKDWRKMDKDLAHRGVDRPETKEEKQLRDTIWALKKELQIESEKGESMQESTEDYISLHDLILSKERDLEQLVCDLDDKVRFGRKAIEKPGLGAVTSEKLPSQFDSSVKFGSEEIKLRPQTPGTGDVRARSGDNIRAFRVMEGGFLGKRDKGKSRSGEKW